MTVVVPDEGIVTDPAAYARTVIEAIGPGDNRDWDVEVIGSSVVD